VLVGAIVATLALRFLSGTAHAPDQGVAPVTSPAATLPAQAKDAAPRVVSYRVQPGDSLWRIAAALTGDGRNWTSLWPATDAARPLAVGTVLEVPIR
jgi:nucleoid-associated protein YgaU